MRYRYSPGIPQKFRDSIAAWGIDPRGIAREIVEHLEKLADDLSPQMSDPSRDDIYTGVKLYRFTIDRLPIVLRIAIAYQISKDEEGEVLQVLDISPVRNT